MIHRVWVWKSKESAFRIQHPGGLLTEHIFSFTKYFIMPNNDTDCQNDITSFPAVSCIFVYILVQNSFRKIVSGEKYVCTWWILCSQWGKMVYFQGVLYIFYNLCLKMRSTTKKMFVVIKHKCDDTDCQNDIRNFPAVSCIFVYILVQNSFRKIEVERNMYVLDESCVRSGGKMVYFQGVVYIL